MYGYLSWVLVGKVPVCSLYVFSMKTGYSLKTQTWGFYLPGQPMCIQIFIKSRLTTCLHVCLFVYLPVSVNEKHMDSPGPLKEEPSVVERWHLTSGKLQFHNHLSAAVRLRKMFHILCVEMYSFDSCHDEWDNCSVVGKEVVLLDLNCCILYCCTPSEVLFKIRSIVLVWKYCKRSFHI